MLTIAEHEEIKAEPIDMNDLEVAQCTEEVDEIEIDKDVLHQELGLSTSQSQEDPLGEVEDVPHRSTTEAIPSSIGQFQIQMLAGSSGLLQVRLLNLD